MPLTVVTGGARSGKSDLAVRLAGAGSHPVVFVATAQAAGDPDMAERIARHRSARPESWLTVEEPLDLKAALAGVGEEETVVIDCLTLWTSNMMLEGFDQESILETARNDAERVAARSGATIVVTNEVGSGVHPPTELGRAFQDVLGRVNVAWSSVAARSYLVVAGKVLSLQDPPA